MVEGLWEQQYTHEVMQMDHPFKQQLDHLFQV